MTFFKGPFAEFNLDHGVPYLKKTILKDGKEIGLLYPANS